MTGLLAANMVVDRVGLGEPAKVYPVEEDEPQIVALKEANKQVRLCYMLIYPEIIYCLLIVIDGQAAMEI